MNNLTEQAKKRVQEKMSNEEYKRDVGLASTLGHRLIPPHVLSRYYIAQDTSEAIDLLSKVEPPLAQTKFLAKITTPIINKLTTIVKNILWQVLEKQEKYNRDMYNSTLHQISELEEIKHRLDKLEKEVFIKSKP